MLNNIINDFYSSPLNTTANVVGTGISIKFLEIAKQTLEVNKKNFELNKINQQNNDLLESILKTNQEIINLLNIIISNQNNN